MAGTVPQPEGRPVHSGPVHSGTFDSKVRVRPSQDYDLKVAARVYGGTEKDRRAAQRRGEAAKRSGGGAADGVATGFLATIEEDKVAQGTATGKGEVASKSSPALATRSAEAKVGEAAAFEVFSVAQDEFNGEEYGTEYLMLNKGDLVRYLLRQEQEWFLGELVDPANRATTLRQGWYPPGFTIMASLSPTLWV